MHIKHTKYNMFTYYTKERRLYESMKGDNMSYHFSNIDKEKTFELYAGRKN